MVSGEDYLAVGLASGGAILHAIAYVLQKYAHNKINDFNSQISLSGISDDSVKQKSFVSNAKWIFGFALFVLGSIMAAVALIFGAQSVVAPLGALTLVANTILAAKFLGKYMNIFLVLI